MRYSRGERLIQLALEMRASRGGVAITDIMEIFSVSRRTAIRMRDAVLRAFPQADEVQNGERTKRWHLPEPPARVLTGVTVEDMAAVESAIQAFEAQNLDAHADSLRALSAKLRAGVHDRTMRQIDPDLEALIEAEGFAHRVGPRQSIPAQTFETIRTAIKSCRKITFTYESLREPSVRQRTVSPLGFLYGHRHYLVAQPHESESFKFFRLAAMSEIRVTTETFEQPDGFHLKSYLSQSFGIYADNPVDVAWRFSAEAAPIASQFVFHHTQAMDHDEAGRLTVRFRAGGLLEMAWHLMCWGHHVEVLAPEKLRGMMPREMPVWPGLP